MYCFFEVLVQSLKKKVKIDRMKPSLFYSRRFMMFFGIVRLFFYFFSPKGPPFNCDKNVDNFGSVPQFREPRSDNGKERQINRLHWIQEN